MQKALVYILLIAVLLPVVSPWGTIMYYHTNKDYIARVLCENRDKPQLHCDGQCYLTKKLKAQQDRQDKQTAQRVQNSPSLNLFCTERDSFEFAPMVLTEHQGKVPDCLLKRYATVQVVHFQPPRA